jgi:DNA-directed RNA polymerase subunit K/omega
MKRKEHKMERKRDMNTYVYVLAVAKRVKQLLKGEKPRVKYKDNNFIKVAKEEIEKGEIIPVIPQDIINNIDSNVENKETEE